MKIVSFNRLRFPEFHPNLGIRGRIIRGFLALVLAVGAFLMASVSTTATIVMAVSSAFVAFEAARGWCALRACGLKSRL